MSSEVLGEGIKKCRIVFVNINQISYEIYYFGLSAGFHALLATIKSSSHMLILLDNQAVLLIYSLSVYFLEYLNEKPILETMTSGKTAYGIIILGSAGSGKSFLCNLIIGSEKFEADFRPEAMTTKTEHYRIETSQCDYLVYNITGLVEINQSQIDHNKQEIQQAFEECPTAIVIFVWTQIGGRAQSDDVIAFKALNDAYAFPQEALMFVVNNVPTSRPTTYEGLFIMTLTNTLQPLSLSDIDIIFIDILDAKDQDQTKSARTKIMKHIVVHRALNQKQQQPIKLQSDQLNDMRNLLKKQQQEAEKDREKFQKQIEKMTEEHNKMQAKADEKYETMMREVANSRNQYVNPFTALLTLVNSVNELVTGTTQAAGLGTLGLLDMATGSTFDEASARVRRVAKGTAAERVHGP